MKDTKINCILLVDDNPADNYYHDIVLTDEQFAEQIITQESVLEALDYLQKTATKPDLILLDVNMPRLDGWQFLERYRQLFPNPSDQSTIFMLTTSINAQDEEKAQASKMVTGFLLKPLDPNDLHAIELKLRTDRSIELTKD